MRFRPAEHIRRRADFERTYNAGARASGRYMTVFARPTQEPVARLGIAATRKIGGAIVRNRAKRRARELFRQHKPERPLDVIVVPRREFVDAPYPSLEREFSNLLERAGSADPQSRASRPPRPSRSGTHSSV